LKIANHTNRFFKSQKYRIKQVNYLRYCNVIFSYSLLILLGPTVVHNRVTLGIQAIHKPFLHETSLSFEQMHFLQI